MSAPNGEQCAGGLCRLYFSDGAAAHGREKADARKIPGALLLGPVPLILFLITEASGVAGADWTGSALAFIPVEAACGLAQSPRGWGSTGGTPRPPQPVTWGPRVWSLISRIVISAHVLTGVINGCESIQSGSGPRRITAASFDGTLPHPWMENQPEGCQAAALALAKHREQPGRVPARAESLIQCQSRQCAGRAQHPPLARSLWPSSGHKPFIPSHPRGLCDIQQKEGGTFPVENDALGAFGISA